MDTLNLNVFVVFTDMLRVSRTVFRAAASVTRAVGRGLISIIFPSPLGGHLTFYDQISVKKMWLLERVSCK